MQDGKMIAGLNEALSRELTTVIRYLLEGSMIKGIENQPLRDLYQKEIPDEIGHARYLADKIVMLGGTPTVKIDVPTLPVEVSKMIQADLKAEESDIELYSKLAEMAGHAGDVELRLKMEEQAADEQRHAEALRRLQG